MEIYSATFTDNDGREFEYECVNIDKNLLKKIKTERDSYFNKKKGSLYDIDCRRTPSMQRFFRLFFGKFVDYDIYAGDIILVPNRFVCDSRSTANQLYGILKDLEYHDSYNQTYCSVNVSGKFVDVFHSDY